MPENKRLQFGGQAVLEGVMMRSRRFWAVSVRRPDKSISSHVVKEISLINKNPVLGFFFIRGIVALIENLALGFKALSYSANEATGEDVKFSSKQMAISVIIALVFVIGLFFVAPTLIGRTFSNYFKNPIVYNLLEGLIRIALFLAYIFLISLLKDIKRLFQYHGAEHKTIQAYEKGVELTPENVRKYSRLHVRCGTSFLLIVMIISILVFALIGKPPILLRIISRILLVPVVIGISYELIRLAGKFSKYKIINILFYPGLLLQKVTTREPDDSQIEVAIDSLKNVIESEENDTSGDKILIKEDEVSINA